MYVCSCISTRVPMFTKHDVPLYQKCIILHVSECFSFDFLKYYPEQLRYFYTLWCILYIKIQLTVCCFSIIHVHVNKAIDFTEILSAFHPLSQEASSNKYRNCVVQLVSLSLQYFRPSFVLLCSELNKFCYLDNRSSMAVTLI